VAGPAARGPAVARGHGRAVPGRVRPGHRPGRAGLVGADPAAGGHQPDAGSAAGLRRRAGPGAVRPARQPAARPRRARTGPAAPGVRQPDSVPRRPDPDHVGRGPPGPF
jgi:hypothetical protein